MRVLLLLAMVACSGEIVDPPAPQSTSERPQKRIALPHVPPEITQAVVRSATLVVTKDGVGLGESCDKPLVDCMPQGEGVVVVESDGQALARGLGQALVAVGRAKHETSYVLVDGANGDTPGFVMVAPLPTPESHGEGDHGLVSVVVEGDRVFLMAMGMPPNRAPKATVSVEQWASLRDEWMAMTMTTVFVSGNVTIEEALGALLEARKRPGFSKATLGVDWMHRPAKSLSDEQAIRHVAEALRQYPTAALRFSASPGGE